MIRGDNKEGEGQKSVQGRETMRLIMMRACLKIILHNNYY